MITQSIALTKIKGIQFVKKDGREMLDITDCKHLGKEKQGQPARYLNLVLWETPNGQYGDYRVTEDLGKDARQSGEKGAILGNGKIRGQGASSPAPAASKPKGNQTGTLNDDFVPPF